MDFLKDLVLPLGLLVAGVCSGLTHGAEADKSRVITFNEDRNQHYITSKVYELKNVNAHDILPFVEGAIKRFDSQSTIQSLSYEAGNRQMLVVSTGVTMMPFVDDMIAKLDYPSPKVDQNGSKIDGDGITRFVYCGKYRTSENMNEVLRQTFAAGITSGVSYFDAPTNMFYWKSGKSEGETYKQFLEAIDRPVPQVMVQLNFYVVSDNNFRELGVDYTGWKNGPSAELFAAGWDFSNFYAIDKFRDATSILSDGPLASATGIGGFAVAPNFDATFLRMLAQKGKAWTASSGMLTLRNDYTDGAADSWDNASYRLRFSPQYQTIVKDEDQKTTVEALDDAEYSFYISTPIVCFTGSPEQQAMTLMCSWNLEVNTVTEQDHTGVATVDSNLFTSALTLQTGVEKIVAGYDKHVITEQYNGMPFVGKIPVIKYLFGTESKVDSKLHIFVTMSATPVITRQVPPPAAGKMIEAIELAAATKSSF